jgi:hypothetical protein
MALTNAEKQARHRTRKAEKMARYQQALEDIAEHPGPLADDACWYRVDIARDALK